MSNEFFARQCFRRAVLSRLAAFADEALHADLGKGVCSNGNFDFEDLFDAWDLGPLEFGRDDGSLSPTEWDLLRSFDAHLDELYWSRFDSDRGPEWDWLYTADVSPPPIWHETVHLAQLALAQFTDFDLIQWRRMDRPVWF